MASFSESSLTGVAVIYNGEVLGELPPHLSTKDMITTIRHRWGPGDYTLQGKTAAGNKGRPAPLLVDDADSMGLGLYVPRETNTPSAESGALSEIVRLVRRQQDQLAEEYERLATRRETDESHARQTGSVEFERYLEFQSQLDKESRKSRERIERERGELELERDRLREERMSARLEAQAAAFEARLERLSGEYQRKIDDLVAELKHSKESGLQLSERLAETIAMRQLAIQLPEPNWLDGIGRNVSQIVEMFEAAAESGMIGALVTAVGSTIRAKPTEEAPERVEVQQELPPEPKNDRLVPILPGFGGTADDLEEDGVTF